MTYSKVFADASANAASRSTKLAPVLERLAPLVAARWESANGPIELTSSSAFRSFIAASPRAMSLTLAERVAFFDLMQALIARSGRHDLRSDLSSARFIQTLA